MGRLPWRERWSVLGCRRGWWRLAAFLAFPLVAYFSLYAWLRATDEIRIKCWIVSGTRGSERITWHRYNVRTRGSPIFANGQLMDWEGQWPRSWAMRAMLPAVKLEIALDRREWLPWDLKVYLPSHMFIPPIFVDLLDDDNA